jgi:Fe-Mn family superoxide dismutase
MSKKHQLPPLPYSMDALAPFISRETLEYHHGKHHAGYVKKLNGLLEGTDFAGKTLEEIIRKAQGALFNNAAQVWNHTFYWNCMAPPDSETPDNEVTRAITQAFTSLETFRKQFNDAAAGQFGSGWAWLVLCPDGKLAITTTANADNPLRDGAVPLLTCDVWEHAYYIDHRNSRADYLEGFWKLVNWDFVNTQYLEADAAPRGRQAVNA